MEGTVGFHDQINANDVQNPLKYLALFLPQKLSSICHRILAVSQCALESQQKSRGHKYLVEMRA